MTLPKIIEYSVPWGRNRRRSVQGAIIHAMGENIVVPGEGVFSAEEFLKRSPELVGAAVSAHRLLKPTGEIFLCVPDDRVTWHAGESRLGDLIGLNGTFLGLEWLLEGTWVYGDFLNAMRTGKAKFTSAQYESGGWQYADWMSRHDFNRHRIVTHAQVAGDDVRGEGLGKVDPGTGFNHGMLSNAITAASPTLQPPADAR